MTPPKDIAHVTVIEAVHCGNCHVWFGLDRDVHTRVKDTGEFFYCPNGHRVHYAETTVQRLEREKAKLERERNLAREDRDRARQTSEQLAASLRSTKGHVTRARKRAASRLDVMTVYCPECKSAPGEPCIGARDRVRVANHQSRVNAHAQSVAATS